MSEVTRVLQAIGDGDAQATAELLTLVYRELRTLAAQKLSPLELCASLAPLRDRGEKRFDGNLRNLVEFVRQTGPDVA